MWALMHDIYEGEAENPIVSHVFYGKTQEEAEDVFTAHCEVDEFLRASTVGEFNGRKLRSVAKAVDLTAAQAASATGG